MEKEQQLEHALNAIRGYCTDITSGKYTLEPGEDALTRISAIAHLAVSGLWNVVEDSAPAG